MALLVTDPDLETRLIEARQHCDGDRSDEVWDGLYIMGPLPDNEHQEVQSNFGAALKEVFGWESPVLIRLRVNVSDRDANWTKNYRCPDVVVFLPGNPAINHGTHWKGGPDFLVEIVSKGDRSRKKLPFYGSVGVREALIIHRKPWKLELYIASGSPDTMRLVGSATLNGNSELRSSVLPISLQMASGKSRPMVRLKLTTSAPAGSRTSWLL